MQYTKKTIRIAVASFAGAAIALALSSCVFANNLSPFDLGIRDGNLVLAVCRGGSIESLSVEQRSATEGGKRVWETVWDGQGNLPTRTGDTVELGSGVDGLSGGPIETLDTQEGTTYVVFVTYGDGNSSEFQPQFVAPTGGLKEGIWLDYSGNASTTACD